MTPTPTPPQDVRKAVSEVNFLIKKGVYYYRDNKCGYTATVADAGRYTKEVAEKEAAIEPWDIKAIDCSRGSDLWRKEVKRLAAECERLGLKFIASELRTTEFYTP